MYVHVGSVTTIAGRKVASERIICYDEEYAMVIWLNREEILNSEGESLYAHYQAIVSHTQMCAGNFYVFII